MPINLSVGSFIRFGWETFKKRPWFLIGAVVLLFIIQSCLNFVVGIVDGVGEASDAQGIAGLISFIINTVGTVVITMGMLAFFLRAHDSVESVQIADAWHPKGFWKFLALLILLYIIFIVGFILFIVPGIIAILMFMFAPYLAVDKGLGPIEALKESARITTGHKWRLMALIGAVALVSLAGVLALFVGLLVAVPVTYLANMHAYRTLSRAAEEGVPPQPLSGGEKALAVVWLLIPILAIIAAIVFISMGVAANLGAAEKNYADLLSVGVSIETYYDANDNKYPTALSDIQSLLPAESTADLSKFSYETDAERSGYTVCATDPVPPGSDQCLSYEATVTETP
jgi:uncharacterized membrane protein